MSASSNNTRMSLRKRNKLRMYQEKGKMFRSSFGTTLSIFTDDDASDKEPGRIAKKVITNALTPILQRGGTRRKNGNVKLPIFLNVLTAKEIL